MSIVNYKNLRKILFGLDPEIAHTVAGFGLKYGSAIPFVDTIVRERYFVDDPVLKQEFFGRVFKNPIGLAAGFDKDGEFIKAASELGFGYTEIGTVTPRPQPGNPKPRLFRLVEERSIQNAMGFNNKGSYHMIQKLKKLKFLDYPIGINIGKNKKTPEVEALKDYETLFRALGDYGTYMVVNISSPNTPGLRNLLNKTFIEELFSMAGEITDKAILLKISPDMSEKEAIELSISAVENGAAGIIATNTTTDYSLSPNAKDFGGISGALLKDKSFSMLQAIAGELFGRTLLVSVGGIDTPQEAYRRIKAGASLLQIFTSFIYEGPALIGRINRDLVRMLKADGYKHISEAIGSDLKK